MPDVPCSIGCCSMISDDARLTVRHISLTPLTCTLRTMCTVPFMLFHLRPSTVVADETEDRVRSLFYAMYAHLSVANTLIHTLPCTKQTRCRGGPRYSRQSRLRRRATRRSRGATRSGGARLGTRPEPDPHSFASPFLAPCRLASARPSHLRDFRRTCPRSLTRLSQRQRIIRRTWLLCTSFIPRLLPT